jgi:hypothetical protein
MVFMFTLGVKPVNAQDDVTVMDQNTGSIVTEYYFADTAYYKALSGYFDGMQFSRSHNDAEQCEIHITALLDSFYFIYQNYTSVYTTEFTDTTNFYYNDPTWFWENQFFNITSIISGPF